MSKLKFLLISIGLPIILAFDIDFQFQHFKGCFKDQVENPDLPFQISDLNAGKSTKTCIDFCKSNFFRFAGLQDGADCFCGNSFGRYGPSSKCSRPCPGAPQETCGGLQANTIYDTKITVPGPPHDLKLEEASETWLKISWAKPKFSPDDFITDYFIHVSVNDSFDLSHNDRTFSPKVIQVSQVSKMTVVLGLRPGSKYNVSVSAASTSGPGPGVSQFFWTQIGDPEEPEAPVIVSHGPDNHGEQIFDF